MTSVVQSKYLREILQILDFGVDIKEIECASEGKSSFLPVFRSGSCAEMGPKQYMEDEHIRIDNLAAKLVIANAGDCGAVLGKRGRAIELSKDHKPDSNKKELMMHNDPERSSALDRNASNTSQAECINRRIQSSKRRIRKQLMTDDSLEIAEESQQRPLPRNTDEIPD
nr:probable protein phosphatase 2C 27 isoform X2 [Ipomoea trifida]